MRVFLGIIFGIFLTVAVAYINDHVIAGSPATTTEAATTDAKGHPVATTPDTTARRPWVNWDVVGSDWRGFSVRARQAWNQLSAKFNKT
jgi:hypothetical protein